MTSFLFCLILALFSGILNETASAANITTSDSAEFSSSKILEKAFKVDNYIRFIKHPDYWNNTVVGGKSRPSNIWTRAVFYEGHMAFYQVSKDTAVFNYSYNWGKHHKWSMAYGSNNTADGDNQCCGQTYLELYQITPSTDMTSNIRACLDNNIAKKYYRNWTWIDAIQMSMPAFAMLGNITGQSKYYDFMYHSYKYTRDSLDVTGLYNKQEGLWWRDKDFNPPFVNSNQKQVYWSRGNGWVYAALVRVLNILPKTEPHYQFYLNDFLQMSKALLACQRQDGFWDSSLADLNEYGGKETSGTALFIYGFAWGINNNLLDRKDYLAATQKGWAAMSRDAIHDNGFLGWMQGTGKQPSDGQPLSFTKVPNFEDYGAGCVLLASAESYKLAQTLEKEGEVTEISSKTLPEMSVISLPNSFQVFNAEGCKVTVYNTQGIKMLYDTTISSSNFILPANNLKKGIYLVEIKDKQNRRISINTLIR